MVSITRFLKGISICLLLCFLISCNKDKKKLVGWWAIDIIRIDGTNRTIDLSINSLVFDNNGAVRLPMFEWKGTEKGSWRIEKDEDDRYLVIESPGNILARRYRLFYFKDPKQKLYKMSLQSDSIVMVCSKGFQHYRE